jgi:hypothetical protein
MDRVDESGQRSVKDLEMEARAVAFARQYGFFLPGPAKAFFRELAAYLAWENLGKAI